MLGKIKETIKKPYFIPISLFSSGIVVFSLVAIILTSPSASNEEKGNDDKLILGSETNEELKNPAEVTSPTSTPTPTPIKSTITPTKKPTATITPSPTSTSTPTPTPIPTNSPSPTESSTPAETPTPSATSSATPT